MAATDYLIIGAGASGLAFADQMLTHSDHHLTIVDSRHAPGGHWNDSYDFVKLHQPSIFYGVESAELGSARVDRDGPNAGFLSLAEGPEIVAYFRKLMQERFLPSGRVRYLPLHTAQKDGTVTHIPTGSGEKITVRRRIVDAAYYTNSVPRTHTRSFGVDDAVTCIPPNDLPRLVTQFQYFTVLGGGKTGMDACIWLMLNGVPEDRIAWVVPRDPWMLNRATTQPGLEFFEQTFGSFAKQRRALADASSPEDLALRFEKIGAWLRLDPDIMPQIYHAPTVSEEELAMLRRVGQIVRKGHVTSLHADGMDMTGGTVDMPTGTLYVDCTASALVQKPAKPVFAGPNITLQMLRFPQIPFSAALAAFLECTFDSDDEKNRFAQPMTLPDTVEDFIRCMVPDMMNRYACAKHPAVRAWINASRLDGYSRIATGADPADTKKMAILNEVREASKAAAPNILRLVAQLKPPMDQAV